MKDVANEFDPEKLRPWDLTMVPDPRTTVLVKCMPDGRNEPIEVEDYHKAVAEFELNSSVPEAIKNYYETARNLYLYAWYIYRFFPVAEQQALFCIEFALREFFQDDEHAPKHQVLSKLLRYAQRKGAIKNEGFTVWQNRAEIRSQQRYKMEQLKKMSDEGLDEIVLDYSTIEVTDEDRDLDYVAILVKTLPRIRVRRQGILDTERKNIRCASGSLV